MTRVPSRLSGAWRLRTSALGAGVSAALFVASCKQSIGMGPGTRVSPTPLSPLAAGPTAPPGVATPMAIATAQPTAEDFGPKYARWYMDNYDKVKNTVGFTADACSAFLTRSLILFGETSVKYDLWAPNVGGSPSRKGDLEQKGWKKIADHTQLRPGDVIVTQDDIARATGDTPHVWVFAGYAAGGKSHGIALDNQGKAYTRNLVPGGKSPFWFALRHPKTLDVGADQGVTSAQGTFTSTSRDDGFSLVQPLGEEAPLPFFAR